MSARSTAALTLLLSLASGFVVATIATGSAAPTDWDPVVRVLGLFVTIYVGWVMTLGFWFRPF